MTKSTHRFYSIAVVGALLMGSAAPALAASHRYSTATTNDGDTVRYDFASGKYCVSSTVTGSWIPNTECKTRNEWAARGLVITRK